MKTQRAALALMVVNLVLLFMSFRNGGSLAAVRVSSLPAQATRTLLRAQVLELVDDKGQIRSRLNVEPDGEVVLRLMDPTGQIRVKLGASGTGSGLLLNDERTEPAVHLIARRSATRERPSTTGITVSGGGRQQVMKP